MDRRALMKSAAAVLAVSTVATSGASAGPWRMGRVRPGRRGWPDRAAWEALGREVDGRLSQPPSPWEACRRDPESAACQEMFRSLKNPYFIRDQPALTQTLGWTDAWTSEPSAYVVEATTAADVQAAVNFARERHVRLVVKGTGHSYIGASNARESLLIWTRRMNAIQIHEAFTPQGGQGRIPAQPAVSVGGGAIWGEVYDAVTTKGGRYVQGGGCTTVGVAGLVQGNGFGSFSKAYGTAGGGLIEAEVVTADGQVRIANAVTNPDLYWALKGGGGGGFGVITRLTLLTHALPKFFGAVSFDVTAKSDAAYRKLIGLTLTHYRDRLLNPHWGEQLGFRHDRTLEVRMLFQGLEQAEAKAAWQPFLDVLRAAPDDYRVSAPLVIALPAQRMWDASFLKQLPGIIRMDDRPGAAPNAFFWDGDAGQVGEVLHGYQSTWLPTALLAEGRIDALADAIQTAAGRWGVSLHCNKGLAGGNEAGRALARDTATNPAVLGAFALAIIGGSEQPAYPGVRGHEPDLAKGRTRAAAIRSAAEPLKRLLDRPASYVSETDYFQEDWQAAFWGENYARLLLIKAQYDPQCLFFTHHGVGTEGWSADGFQRAG